MAAVFGVMMILTMSKTDFHRSKQRMMRNNETEVMINNSEKEEVNNDNEKDDDHIKNIEIEDREK